MSTYPLLINPFSVRLFGPLEPSSSFNATLRASPITFESDIGETFGGIVLSEHTIAKLKSAHVGSIFVNSESDLTVFSGFKVRSFDVLDEVVCTDLTSPVSTSAHNGSVGTVNSSTQVDDVIVSSSIIATTIIAHFAEYVNRCWNWHLAGQSNIRYESYTTNQQVTFRPTNNDGSFKVATARTNAIKNQYNTTATPVTVRLPNGTYVDVLAFV